MSSFNYTPLKHAAQMACSADDLVPPPVASSWRGMPPTAVSDPGHKTGLTKVPTETTRPSDLVDGAALGMKSKTLKALDSSVNLGSASQRVKDIASFLAKKAEREKAQTGTSAVPDPQFYPTRDWAGDRTPKYAAQAKMGIPGSFEPVNFIRARTAASAQLRAAGLGAKWNAPIGVQNPTGGIDEDRITKMNANLITSYGAERY